MNNWDVDAADVWGACSEGNLAFVLLSGSTPWSVLQAKIMLIYLKDDELTFCTEVTLENWDLQSDIDKLAEILVRKPGWVVGGTEKKIFLLMATTVPFYLQFPTFMGYFSVSVLSLILNCHFTQLILHNAGKSDKFDSGPLSSLFT